MDSFEGKLAVVSGAASGMGRALALQLTRAGCSVAMCDVLSEEVERTRSECEREASQAVRVTSHLCDVSDERSVLAFRDSVAKEHETDCVQLLFNNAGIGGGESFIADSRADWDRVFSVCWGGVYYMTRAFMPMLVASDEARLVNTSSVNGFWASLGPSAPQSAYAAAKFAVKGFSEGLIQDLRLNAPHVRVHVVLPGHVGTSMVHNSFRILGKPMPEDMSTEELAPIRERLDRMGVSSESLSDEQLRVAIRMRVDGFRDGAPTTADEAAAVMLQGVRDQRWRILVGADAQALDTAVSLRPEAAYDSDFLGQLKAKPAVWPSPDEKSGSATTQSGTPDE